jgi:lysophospholipid acyltransferase (LPLAT)-like uncharacterized protein
MWSWRIRVFEHPEAIRTLQNKTPTVLAHWHGDEYSLIHLVSRYKSATMVSTSKDGQVVDYLVKKLGGDSSRGSSTRGAVTGLKGLIRLLRSGRVTSIAVDGPRGPYHEPKPGVFEIAKLARGKILPVGVAVSSAVRFEKSWNKAYLPLPFAKVQVYVSEPFENIESNQDPRDKNLAQRLANRIDDANSQASKLIATP